MIFESCYVARGIILECLLDHRCAFFPVISHVEVTEFLRGCYQLLPLGNYDTVAQNRNAAFCDGIFDMPSSSCVEQYYHRQGSAFDKVSTLTAGRGLTVDPELALGSRADAGVNDDSCISR